MIRVGSEKADSDWSDSHGERYYHLLAMATVGPDERVALVREGRTLRQHSRRLRRQAAVLRRRTGRLSEALADRIRHSSFARPLALRGSSDAAGGAPRGTNESVCRACGERIPAGAGRYRLGETEYPPVCFRKLWAPRPRRS